MDSPTQNRRKFLGSISCGIAGMTCLNMGNLAFSQTGKSSEVLPPTNLRLATETSRSLITPDDMKYQGMCKVPDSVTLRGANIEFSYSIGPMTYRYVMNENNVAERRILYVCKKDLVELREPTSYGTSISTAPSVTVTNCWKSVFEMRELTGELLTDPNGFMVGGIWWDEELKLLWYTLYPIYSPTHFPVLGALRLNNDGTIANKYGMWRYAGHEKSINQWICPIPSSAQNKLKGKSFTMGGCVTNMGAGCNWGPGLFALEKPALDYTGTIPLGTPLQAYDGSGGAEFPDNFCWREPDYRNLAESTVAPSPIGDRGFWAGPLDTANVFAWVETKTKHGVIVMGRRVSGRVWYGLGDAYANTEKKENGDPLIDPCSLYQGYHAEFYAPSMWIFDPNDMMGVLDGKMKPNEVRYKIRDDWSKKWPQIPARPDGIYIDNPTSNGVYDSTTNQLIWVYALSNNPDYSRLPTIHVWNIPD